jgi:hypothetical protein
MSAYLSAVFPDSIEVLSDAAMLTPDFKLGAITRKIMVIGELPLVMTGRGDVIALGAYAIRLRELAACGSVDGTLAAFREFLKSEKEGGRKFHVAQDFLVAGWSESAGPFHYLIVGAAGMPGGFAPFELIEVPRVWVGGTFDDEEFYKAGFYGDSFDGGLRHYGVKLFEAFRKKPVFQLGSDVPICGIGGHVHISTITASGVRIETLGTWPDLIGENIDPIGVLWPTPPKREALEFNHWREAER